MQFQKTCAELATLHDVTVDQTGSESQNSIDIGERYHAPLRNTYLKLYHERPDVDRDLILTLSNKAMNDTLGPEGVVPSASMFESFHLFAHIWALTYRVPFLRNEQ